MFLPVFCNRLLSSRYIQLPPLFFTEVFFQNAPHNIELKELRNLPELEEFENGRFTLKTHRMLCVYTTPDKFQKAIITGYFGFVFNENSGGEIKR